MLEQRYKIFIFLTIYFQYVCGSIDSAESDKEPNLKEIINSLRTEQFFHEKSNHSEKDVSRRSIDLIKFAKSFLGRSRLVKRIIPHNYRASSVEFDSVLNTIYRPLIRFHVIKKKKISLKDILRNANAVNTVGYALNPLYREIGYGKKKWSDGYAWTRLEHKKETDSGLRTHHHGGHIGLTLDDKTSEEDPLLEPGHIPIWDSSLEEPGRPAVIPTYPFWNSWTYGKIIHQDDCPGNLVKLGEVCIAPSGHRRYQRRP